MGLFDLEAPKVQMNFTAKDLQLLVDSHATDGSEKLEVNSFPGLSLFFQLHLCLSLCSSISNFLKKNK